MGTIAHLPIRTALTARPMNDPPNWHKGPYCHVYLAPCESMEHYRTKVRPAIRAFVNQIEGSGTVTLAMMGGGGGDGGHAVIDDADVSVAPGNGNGSSSAPYSGNKPSAHEKALARAGLSASAAGNFGFRYVEV